MASIHNRWSESGYPLDQDVEFSVAPPSGSTATAVASAALSQGQSFNDNDWNMHVLASDRVASPISVEAPNRHAFSLTFPVPTLTISENLFRSDQQAVLFFRDPKSGVQISHSMSMKNIRTFAGFHLDWDVPNSSNPTAITENLETLNHKVTQFYLQALDQGIQINNFHNLHDLFNAMQESNQPPVQIQGPKPLSGAYVSPQMLLACGLVAADGPNAPPSSLKTLVRNRLFEPRLMAIIGRFLGKEDPPFPLDINWTLKSHKPTTLWASATPHEYIAPGIVEVIAPKRPNWTLHTGTMRRRALNNQTYSIHSIEVRGNKDQQEIVLTWRLLATQDDIASSKGDKPSLLIQDPVYSLLEVDRNGYYLPITIKRKEE
jgi:hypothetical protein